MLLTAFVWTAIVIGLLLLAVLLIPIRIRLSGLVDDQRGFGYQVVIDWAFGFLMVYAVDGQPISLFFLGLRVWRFSLKPRKKEKAEKKLKDKLYSAKAVSGWIQKYFQRINLIVKRFARAIFLKGYISGRVGLPDPADTAKIAFFCDRLRIQEGRFQLAIACVYGHEMINMKACAQATLIIGYLGLVALRLILERETRIMLRSLPQT